jgi:hypothetical protein
MAALKQFPEEVPLKWGVIETQQMARAIVGGVVSLVVIIFGAVPLWLWQGDLSRRAAQAASTAEFDHLNVVQALAVGAAIFVTVAAGAALIICVMCVFSINNEWLNVQGNRRAQEVRKLDFDYDAPEIRELVLVIAGHPDGSITYSRDAVEKTTARFPRAYFDGVAADGRGQINSAVTVTLLVPQETNLATMLGLEAVVEPDS